MPYKFNGNPIENMSKRTCLSKLAGAVLACSGIAPAVSFATQCADAGFTVSGTLDDVKAVVGHLAETAFYTDRKLILDGVFGIPDGARVENIRSMCEAARRYTA